MKIKSGDTVKIITGKDKGKNGKVTEVFPKINKIIVENLNIVKKHVKPKKQGERGQKVEVPRAINISNVQIVCPKCKKPTRIGQKLLENGKIRLCKKCGQEI
ncbi:MAG TPA: 50S ribosomal protein L24 [Candidatus Portnoybacteria bacterium]|jgi:large subunit ribosomal protein L24|nr:50S ribosomal protein L24 [Candidatus Portnoybacteria bacterium]MDD5751942.1 50S ribosomal protein L24 [Candidatus Portnoybacteria bacterium]HNU96702.1 50S ribosomal protein L24 [Candidatus Portnoybacteria bacterium]HOZ16254.1 50S ribosomal protein L24 [Candidatus Portnoybacteria bacterium]HPH51950.1 50S ribosomal protein L24 [Candidatus Portnoybacteria bacterium]